MSTSKKTTRGKKKAPRKGFVQYLRECFGAKEKDVEKDILIKKQNLEILSLRASVSVYEKAILNEREVSTKCLKRLEELLREKNKGR